MSKKIKIKTFELDAFKILVSNEWLTIKARVGDFEYKVRFDTRDYAFMKHLLDSNMMDEVNVMCQTLMSARLIFADIKGNCIKSILQMATDYGKSEGYLEEDDSEILKEEKIKDEYNQKDISHIHKEDFSKDNLCKISGDYGWNKTTDSKPLGKRVVATKIDDGNSTRNEQNLIYHNNMWWLEDMSMYVYYTPTHWKYN